MDILKSAIDLMSSRKEDPKPKKPFTLQDLKNFVEYGGGIDKLRVARGTPSKTVKRSEDDLFYGSPIYNLLSDSDMKGSALAGLLPKNRKIELPPVQLDLSGTKIKGLGDKIAPRFQEQLQYMFDYIRSPKYRERLSKTYDRELEIRKKDPRMNSSDRAFLINKDGSYPQGYTDSDFKSGIFPQFTDNKALKKRQIDHVISTGIAELMGLANKGIKFQDKSMTNSREQVGAFATPGKTVFDTAYQKEKNRGSVVNWKAGPNGPKDQWGQPLTEVDEDRGYAMPVHEFSHSSTLTNDPYTWEFFRKYIGGKGEDDGIFKGSVGFGGNYHSVASPTELKARIDAIRFLAKKNGIWDAGKSDITDEQVEKLLNHPKIRGNEQLGEVLRIIGDTKDKKQGFKWLLNNIAKNKSNKPSQPDQGSLA
jgi:hypothetical protein